MVKRIEQPNSQKKTSSHDVQHHDNQEANKVLWMGPSKVNESIHLGNLLTMVKAIMVKTYFVLFHLWQCNIHEEQFNSPKDDLCPYSTGLKPWLLPWQQVMPECAALCNMNNMKLTCGLATCINQVESSVFGSICSNISITVHWKIAF